MSNFSDQDRVIAFAGIYQAAALVHQLATQGQSDSVAISATLNSLFIQNPESTLAVFNDLSGIKLGLLTLRSQLNYTQAVGEKRNLQITQYAVGMLALEKTLRNNEEMEESVFKKLTVPESQAKHFGLLHENTAAGLALIYTETLSRLRPKILVHGAHGHLSQPMIANRIRACLLAGVRSGRLWHQVGGNRWQLLLQRGRYSVALDELITQLREEDSPI